MPASMAWRGVGKGLSPICSSMTSLRWDLRRLATASTSKAVSAVRLRAKLLKRIGVVFMRGIHESETSTKSHEITRKTQKGKKKEKPRDRASLQLFRFHLLFS